MLDWNLESHILDHAALVSNNLTESFNLDDPKNIHFTASIDKCQLLINHNCKNQKDIDLMMKAFFDDLSKYEYQFEESQGKNRPKRKMSLDLSQMLFAYHNTDSDSVNSKNYEVEPHYHFLIPSKLKNKFGKSTKVGKGYINLRRMINEVAAQHNITFNFDENVEHSNDKILKIKATKYSWFTKIVNDQYFKDSIGNGRVNQYIKDFITHYKNTENIQYYIKGMLDFQERLKRQNLDFFYEEKNLRIEPFPLFLNETQLKSLDIINTGNESLIKALAEDRSNRLVRAYIEYTYGFNNVIIKELQDRGNIFKKIKLNLSNTHVDIKKKVPGKGKYKLSLHYHVSEDVNKALEICVSDKNFLEVMKDFGYENIKFKAKTNEKRSRQRVGFTFEKDKEKYTVYFNTLNLVYQDFTKAYKTNVNKPKDEIIKSFTDIEDYQAKIDYYIPLKKNTSYQEKIYYKIYKITPNINLADYYIKGIEQGAVEFINKKKDIHVKDMGDIITSARSIINLKEKASLMLEIVKAKGWDIQNLEISGTDDFKKEIYRQIQDLVEIEKKNDLENIDTEIQENPEARNEKENFEEIDNLDLSDENLNASRAYLKEVFKEQQEQEEKKKGLNYE